MISDCDDNWVEEVSQEYSVLQMYCRDIAGVIAVYCSQVLPELRAGTKWKRDSSDGSSVQDAIITVVASSVLI